MNSSHTHKEIHANDIAQSLRGVSPQAQPSAPFREALRSRMHNHAAQISSHKNIEDQNQALPYTQAIQTNLQKSWILSPYMKTIFAGASFAFLLIFGITLFGNSGDKNNPSQGTQLAFNTPSKTNTQGIDLTRQPFLANENPTRPTNTEGSNNNQNPTGETLVGESIFVNANNYYNNTATIENNPSEQTNPTQPPVIFIGEGDYGGPGTSFQNPISITTEIDEEDDPSSSNQPIIVAASTNQEPVNTGTTSNQTTETSAASISETANTPLARIMSPLLSYQESTPETILISVVDSNGNHVQNAEIEIENSVNDNFDIETDPRGNVIFTPTYPTEQEAQNQLAVDRNPYLFEIRIDDGPETNWEEFEGILSSSETPWIITLN